MSIPKTPSTIRTALSRAKAIHSKSASRIRELEQALTKLSKPLSIAQLSSQISSQLKRCGAQKDSSAIVTRNNRDGTLAITDGQGEETASAAEAARILKRLAALRTNAGWDAAWEAILNR